MKKVKLSDYDNTHYQPGSFLKRVAWIFFGRIFIYTYFPYPQVLKKSILRLFGAKIAAGVVIKQKVLVKYPWFLSIEENAWIGENVWIDNLTQVTIGSNACLSQGAMLLTGNHDFKSAKFDLMTQAITIEEGAWVGAQGTVCPGVKMASHSILSVGSILTTSTEPYQIYQGNPASVVRKREII